MLRIDEIELDTNEEWLVRNALSCYRDAVLKCAGDEREHAQRFRDKGADELAKRCDSLAAEWDRTTQRVLALEEKLG